MQETLCVRFSGGCKQEGRVYVCWENVHHGDAHERLGETCEEINREAVSTSPLWARQGKQLQFYAVLTLKAFELSCSIFSVLVGLGIARDEMHDIYFGRRRGYKMQHCRGKGFDLIVQKVYTLFDSLLHLATNQDVIL